MSEYHDQRRPLQHAVAMFRLCSGMEYALATKGYTATVADALHAVKMSRRSFYEFFTNTEEMIRRMHVATAVMTELYMRAGPVCNIEQAYKLAVDGWPHAEPMLLVMGGGRAIDSHRLTTEAVDCQRLSWMRNSPPGGTPRVCDCIEEKWMMAWSSAITTGKHEDAARHVFTQESQ